MNEIDDLIARCQTLEELQAIADAVNEAIAQWKEKPSSNGLATCIMALASWCDGANARDGMGFNKPDSSFGKWLAGRFRLGLPVKRSQVMQGYKLCVKYKNQLIGNGIELPVWADISDLYSEDVIASQNALRVECRGEAIAVFTYAVQNYKLKEIQPKPRFDWDEKCWLFGERQSVEIKEAISFLEQQHGCQYDIDYGFQVKVERELARREIEEKEERDRLKQEEQAKLEKAEKAASKILSLIEHARVDDLLHNGWSLFDHQKEAVKWLVSHGDAGIFGGGILADQPGLGKTISTLVSARAVKEIYNCHVFVICPVAVMDVWRREAENVGVTIEVFSWAKPPQPLERLQYLLICDEAHYMQNRKANRTKNVLALAKHQNCLYAWMVTGTPLKNGRPENLYPLLDAIAHPLAANRFEYEKRYCNAHRRQVNRKGTTIWDTTGAAHLDELAELTKDCILQRKKSDCLDLPPKTRIFKPVELEPNRKKAYKKEIEDAIADYKARCEIGEVDADAEALVTLGILRKIGSKYKVQATLEFIIELLELGEPVVAFFEFLESAKLLYEELERATVNGKAIAPVFLHGGTSADDRTAMIDRFQNGESQAFIGTIKAGGVGITLHRANHIFLCDRPWTPGDAEQAEDRCHRIGQSQNVSVFWMQLGEIDTAIDAIITAKQQRIDLVMAGKRKTLRGVDRGIKELAKEIIHLVS